MTLNVSSPPVSIAVEVAGTTLPNVSVPVPSVTVSDAQMVTSLQADGYTVTAPSAPQTPPASGSLAVLIAGVLNTAGGWVGDWSYGGVTVKYGALAPDGSLAAMITAGNANGNPPGGGGWQPFYQPNPAVPAGGFSATGLFLNLQLWATRAGQVWIVGDQGTGDTGVSTAAGPSLTASAIGKWLSFKIPAAQTVGGLYIPATATIEKFDVQDQMPYSNESNATGNVWYVQNAWWSAT